MKRLFLLLTLCVTINMMAQEKYEVTPYAYLDHFTCPQNIEEKVFIAKYYPHQFYNPLILDNQTGFYYVKANGKYGIIDEYDNVCLPVIFDALVPATSQQIYDNLIFKFQKDGKWGCCYYDGTIVLFPFYTSISIDENYYYVTEADGTRHQLTRDEDERYEKVWAFARREGLKYGIYKSFHLDFSECKKIYMDEFELPSKNPISDGYVCVKDKATGAYQFFDSKGNIAIPYSSLPSYVGDMNSNHGLKYRLPQFHNGYCVFRKDKVNANSEYLIVDTTGYKVLLPASTSSCTDFEVGGYAIKFVQEGIYLHPVYINGKGQEIMSGIYGGRKFPIDYVDRNVNQYVRPCCCGMIAFYDFAKELWGFADANGKIVVAPKFEKVLDFTEDLAAVKMPKTADTPGKWGFIDKTGQFVIPARYTNEPWEFSENIAAVQKTNDHWVFIDKSGNVISKEFQNVTPFVNGLAFVKDFGRKSSFINTKMEIVRGDLACEWPAYFPWVDRTTGYYLVQEEDYIMQECVVQRTKDLVYVCLRPSKWQYEPVRHLFCDPTGKVIFELCLNEF